MSNVKRFVHISSCMYVLYSISRTPRQNTSIVWNGGQRSTLTITCIYNNTCTTVTVTTTMPQTFKVPVSTKSGRNTQKLSILLSCHIISNFIFANCGCSTASLIKAIINVFYSLSTQTIQWQMLGPAASEICSDKRTTTTSTTKRKGWEQNKFLTCVTNGISVCSTDFVLISSVILVSFRSKLAWCCTAAAIFPRTGLVSAFILQICTQNSPYTVISQRDLAKLHMNTKKAKCIYRKTVTQSLFKES